MCSTKLFLRILVQDTVFMYRNLLLCEHFIYRLHGISNLRIPNGPDKLPFLDVSERNSFHMRFSL